MCKTVEKGRKIMSNLMLSPYSSIDAFQNCQQMANALANSRFVPAMFRNSEPDCIMVIGIAARIGADPLAVMNSIYEVHGKIGFSSKFLIATVNASGKFSPIRWSFFGQKGQDDYGCTAYAVEKETKEKLIGPPITIAMAKAEGWAKPGKNKKTGETLPSKWETMPELMLRYRAASFWISLYASELALGMRTQEELDDEQSDVVLGNDGVTVNAQVVNPPKNIDQLMEQVEHPSAFTGPESDPDAKQELIDKAREMWPRGWENALKSMAKSMCKVDVDSLDELSDQHASNMLDALIEQHQITKGGAI